MFDDEMSPEDLFRQFFGGGMGGGFGGGGGGPFGGGGGLFDTGPQFVFNLGGGPGIRVHQFGGARPRRRPQAANNTQQEATNPGVSALTQLLPLLILFILPLLSSLFSSSTPAGPTFRFEKPVPPHTMQRTTNNYKVDYWVNPKEVDDFSQRQFNQLDKRAEVDYISGVRYNCDVEVQNRQRLMEDAQGWFFVDEAKMQEARTMDLPNCQKLRDMRLGGYY